MAGQNRDTPGIWDSHVQPLWVPSPLAPFPAAHVSSIVPNVDDNSMHPPAEVVVNVGDILTGPETCHR